MAWYATKKASKLPALDKSKILVFDTETTGTRSTDEILQITILDGYGTTLFSSLIHPKRKKVGRKQSRSTLLRASWALGPLLPGIVDRLLYCCGCGYPATASRRYETSSSRRARTLHCKMQVPR